MRPLLALWRYLMLHMSFFGASRRRREALTVVGVVALKSSAVMARSQAVRSEMVRYTLLTVTLHALRHGYVLCCNWYHSISHALQRTGCFVLFSLLDGSFEFVPAVFVAFLSGGDGDVTGSAQSAIPRPSVHSEGEPREQANHTSVSSVPMSLR